MQFLHNLIYEEKCLFGALLPDPKNQEISENILSLNKIMNSLKTKNKKTGKY